GRGARPSGDRRGGRRHRHAGARLEGRADGRGHRGRGDDGGPRPARRARRVRAGDERDGDRGRGRDRGGRGPREGQGDGTPRRGGPRPERPGGPRGARGGEDRTIAPAPDRRGHVPHRGRRILERRLRGGAARPRDPTVTDKADTGPPVGGRGRGRAGSDALSWDLVVPVKRLDGAALAATRVRRVLVVTAD